MQLPMFDPMARDKLRAYSDFTYSTPSLTYRSVLDKVFTSFSPDHCGRSSVLTWDSNTNIRLSDHRPV
jgi:hypothetical protein